MIWKVDGSSTIDLADQLASQIRHGIAVGDLKPGERLPSAKDLGSLLGINLHTVLRAYQVLRDEGLVELRRGRGATVSAAPEIERAAFDEHLIELVREARRLGLSVAEVQEAVAAKLGGAGLTGQRTTSEE